MAKYYKCLRPNPLRASWYDEKFIWRKSDAVEVKNAEPGGPCGVGLHLAKSIDNAFLNGHFPALVYEAEPMSPVLGENHTKIRVAKARLVKRVHEPWIDGVNNFLTSITQVKWFANHKPPLKSWHIFSTKAAARAAVEKIVHGNIWNSEQRSMWDIVEGATVYDERNAVLCAAEDAAWFKVWDVTEGAPPQVKRAAARDAMFFAGVTVYGDDLPARPAEHARARWEVWERGYGLLCDIDGEFYVYKNP